jgi:putative solute:sodium symporter small subunit
MEKKDDTILYWQRVKSLIRNLLIVWFVVVFIPPLFAKWLSGITMIGGWPMHYFLSAIVALATFLVILVIYYKQMEKIDIEFGREEE